MHVPAADTFLLRFRGLMLTKSLADSHGLLILDCPGIHTAFMRYAIDVVYLDECGNVLRCVSRLRPWRCSTSSIGRNINGRRNATAAHTLELAGGTIYRLDIRPGDWLEHPALTTPPDRRIFSVCASTPVPRSTDRMRQGGATMLEFALVGPLITLIGLGVLQYSLLFFAKNQINHATFLAARAGSTDHALLPAVRDAFAKGLIPLYGDELPTAVCKARDEVEGTTRCLTGNPPPGVTIELLNPTRESFDDWNDPSLQDTIGGGRRVIPNSGQAYKDPAVIKPDSGQNIQDANILKLRATYGYLPKVPLMGTVFNKYLKWLDDGSDPLRSSLIESGRIPIVTDVALQMQSDAIEPDKPASSPGMGNNGNPVNPGNSSSPIGEPPDCLTVGCSVEATPADPGGGGSGNGGNGGGGSGNGGNNTGTDGVGCAGSACLVCEAAGSISSDVLFAFGRSSMSDLLPAGRRQLDELIEKARTGRVVSAHVVGHTDPLNDSGDAGYNDRLSLARAATVRDYLQQHGYPAVPITVEGRGARELVKTLDQCTGTREQQISCLAPNRRVIVYDKYVP
ncbi:MAG: putative rane protein family [Noviherbaspirillum sp.]|nr:putative rane protein family [Noviherbaspirillum sp.]